MDMHYSCDFTKLNPYNPNLKQYKIQMYITWVIQDKITVFI